LRVKSEITIAGQIESSICFVRGQKVMLDYQLAVLYGVEARVLNQAVKRNAARFPHDFMFQLTRVEAQAILTDDRTNSSQFVMSSRKHRGLSYRPFAFAEQGVAMLSSVLRSPRAVSVNIEIMRAFVRLRQMLASNVELNQKFRLLERKYDKKFKIVFEAIRELMRDPRPVRSGEIGFHTVPPKTIQQRAETL